MYDDGVSSPRAYEAAPSRAGVIAIAIGPALSIAVLLGAFARPAPPPPPQPPPPPSPLAAMAHAPPAELVFVVESDAAIDRVVVEGSKRVDVQGNRATITLAPFVGTRDAELALAGGGRARVALVADGPRALFAAARASAAPSQSSPLIRRSFGLRGPLLRAAPEP